MLESLEKLFTDEKYAKFLTKLREFVREYNLELYHRDSNDECDVYEFMLVRLFNGRFYYNAFIMQYDGIDNDVDKAFSEITEWYLASFDKKEEES